MVGESGKESSTLRREIDYFVWMITIIAFVFGIIFFILAKWIVNLDWLISIVFCIGILVANIPEGLLGLVTVALTVTAVRM